MMYNKRGIPTLSFAASRTGAMVHFKFNKQASYQSVNAKINNNDKLMITTPF